MNEEVIYYKFKPREQPPSGVDYEIAGHEYKGFLLTREPVYLFWSIAYPDGSEVPFELRDRRYTDRTNVHEAVDKYLDDERAKQEASTKQ
jgi:hypothetical protein